MDLCGIKQYRMASKANSNFRKIKKRNEEGAGAKKSLT